MARQGVSPYLVKKMSRPSGCRTAAHTVVINSRSVSGLRGFGYSGMFAALYATAATAIFDGHSPGLGIYAVVSRFMRRRVFRGIQDFGGDSVRL
jgi:hypothetical protein